jgi:hypothetical protein
VNKNFKEYMRYLGNYKNQIVDKFSAKAKECKHYGKRDNTCRLIVGILIDVDTIFVFFMDVLSL